MRIAAVVLAVALLGLAPILRGETLGAVLTANKLPPYLIKDAERSIKPKTIHYTCSLRDGKWTLTP